MTPLSFRDITTRLAAWTFPSELDGVVGIASGGVVPASLVAMRLGVDLKIIALNYRDDANEPRFAEPRLLSNVPRLDGWKRVLLVDHYPTSRQIVRHYLETTWEMRVETADRADEVLALLRRELASGDPFRVLLFDAMPDMEPFAFAREVRAREEIAGTSLVHLANTARDTNQERLRESGIDAFVAKPVGQGELFDAMTIALAHDAIPLARPAAQPSDSRSAPPDVTPEQRKSIRVLLAEDNFLNRKLTMSQLEKLGYIADSAGNGKEALEALARESYDVILMDCQMPVMDGYEATMEIRRRDTAAGHKRRRIIAMTANALEGDREKCLAAGMDDYLAKPTRHEDLERALARYFA